MTKIEELAALARKADELARLCDEAITVGRDKWDFLKRTQEEADRRCQAAIEFISTLDAESMNDVLTLLEVAYSKWGEGQATEYRPADRESLEATINRCLNAALAGMLRFGALDGFALGEYHAAPETWAETERRARLAASLAAEGTNP